MNDLKNNLKKVNIIDDKLISLFNDRLILSIKIAKEKVNNNQKIIDNNFENQILINQLKKLSNKDLESYIIDFYKDVSLITKQCQVNSVKNLIDKDKKE